MTNHSECLMTNHSEGARDSTNQSLPPGMQPRHWRYKRRVPSFLALSFNDAVPTTRRFVREIVERRKKNTSVSSRGLRSRDISRPFDGGATNRSRPPWYYKQKHSSCGYTPVATAEKSFRRTKTYDNIWTVTCYHLAARYVPRAVEGSLDGQTWSDTRVAAHQNRSSVVFVIALSVGNGSSTGMRKRCGAGDHRNQDHRHRNARKSRICAKTPCSRRRSNTPLMTTSLVIYETSCTRSGPACGHTWSTAPCRHAITTG